MKQESSRIEIRRLLDEASVEAPPETAIRGSGNIINSQVTLKGGRLAAALPVRAPRGEPRRRELLEAVRARAARLTLTEDQVCEIAATELRKKVFVLSLARLGADDLARVYEALSTRKRPARDRALTSKRRLGARKRLSEQSDRGPRLADQHNANIARRHRGRAYSRVVNPSVLPALPPARHHSGVGLRRFSDSCRKSAERHACTSRPRKSA